MYALSMLTTPHLANLGALHKTSPNDAAHQWHARWRNGRHNSWKARWSSSCARFFAIIIVLASIAVSKPAVAASILMTDRQPTPLALTAEQITWLKSKRVLKVATKADWHPIDVSYNSGTYTGISGDYLRLLSAKLGLAIEVTQYSSNDEAIAAVVSGKADILPSLVATPQRLEKLQFTRPYLDVPNAVFARIEQRSIGCRRDAQLARHLRHVTKPRRQQSADDEIGKIDKGNCNPSGQQHPIALHVWLSGFAGRRPSDSGLRHSAPTRHVALHWTLW